MVRLSRVETQERNRAKVLEAARREFAERGFRDAKIDVIAEHAELTRGAVYSNFPGKRALYFAVLTDLAEQLPGRLQPGATAREALAAFARSWVTRLPLATDQQYDSARLGMDLLPEILADEHLRQPYAQLMRLNAVVLGLALERFRPAHRLVRVAEAVLTTLHGATQLGAAAPGFVEPFNVVTACEQLLELDVEDHWTGAPIVPRTRPVDEPWTAPDAVDALRAAPTRLQDDGIVAVLGLHRLAAAEEAVRAAPPDAQVTALLVTSDPAELGRLARLTIAEVATRLRHAFPPEAWPRLRLIHDETGRLAAAAGVSAVSDATETAVRIESGRIVLRAEGFGACHAVAAADHQAKTPH